MHTCVRVSVCRNLGVWGKEVVCRVLLRFRGHVKGEVRKRGILGGRSIFEGVGIMVCLAKHHSENMLACLSEKE